MSTVKDTTPKPAANVSLPAWRERMGYSPAEGAEALGCSLDDLTRWEAGYPTPRYIGLACAALAMGMSPYQD